MLLKAIPDKILQEIIIKNLPYPAIELGKIPYKIPGKYG